MIGQGLRQLQDALNQKADAVQREFIAAGEQVQALTRKISETRHADPAPLIAEREALHAKQQALAGEVNEWRERARGALRQQSETALRAYLANLLTTEDEAVRAAVAQCLFMLDATEEELAKLSQRQAQAKPTTAVGRLIERARTEFDLRGNDLAARQKAALEFAARTGMAQNDEALAELEAALTEPDPLVNEVVTLTLIQMHRYRAMRLADLDAGNLSVERLTQLQHPAVIPVLIEVLESPRTGFVQGKDGMVSGNNQHARTVALTRLVEWHTSEAHHAVQIRQQDRDSQIARIARAALEADPGPWQ